MLVAHCYFQVTNKQGKLYTFYLSSEYERTEWLRSLQEVQKALPPNPLMLHRDAKAMSMAGLQGYLTKNRQHLQVINCNIFSKIKFDIECIRLRQMIILYTYFNLI